MNLIIQALLLATANPVETVMQVLQINEITDVLKRDIYNIKNFFFFSKTKHRRRCMPLSFTFMKKVTSSSSLWTEKTEFVLCSSLTKRLSRKQESCSSQLLSLSRIKPIRTSNVTSTLSDRGRLQTFSVASAWVNNELETAYTWVFQLLKKSVWPTTEHGCPEVFVTDNNKSVHNAIKSLSSLALWLIT
ncbi:hypothetical protein BCV72DRAFT_329111 [Rhizopus microsporus var. microsporus]|uniref:MULE transposase domain-containing protein n=1 Tax=Rhizopus microsporus var. microsporus TaxID=86635 RepID=A0A1X0R2X5_RHIZD|nr:hypothetical protein BCV72DRAFT_329111 [Rhizopus microsporus var. microsporus]